ncbi:MAG TPA: hypothetical protein VMJ70_00605 [Candidatus Sulfotelmatobacter sp.]|nr:hypothetical protein [Candidatus Sulfotelmatobacter sp.]
MKRSSRVILALAMPAAAALALAGCGNQNDHSVSTSSSQGSVAEASEAVPASNVPPASTSPQMAGGGTTPARNDSLSHPASEGMPPDIVAAATDSAVAPGEAVEIGVEGTPDVTEVTLSDGLHTPQALYFDSEVKTWRAVYRVPLRPSSDRVALAITARNDVNRWRRVWVFIKVRGEAQRESTSGVDSSK